MRSGGVGDEEHFLLVRRFKEGVGNDAWVHEGLNGKIGSERNN